MRLYEIGQQYEELRLLMEEHADDEECGAIIAAALDENRDALEEKLDSCACVLSELRAREETYKAEITRLTRLSIVAIKNQARLKQAMLDAMTKAGCQKVTGRRFNMIVAKTAPKIVIDDEALITEEYFIPQPAKLDKRSLLASAKLGDVHGCHLESGKSLRIK